MVKGGNASIVDYGVYDNRKRACVGVIDWGVRTDSVK